MAGAGEKGRGIRDEASRGPVFCPSGDASCALLQKSLLPHDEVLKILLLQLESFLFTFGSLIHVEFVSDPASSPAPDCLPVWLRADRVPGPPPHPDPGQ